MLESPKWQTMWMESQHCSKSFLNMSSQQIKILLEDLKRSCSSSSKEVQVEALKCWGIWINNQNLDSWKINTVCYTAVRPLLTKKLEPLYKDEDICKLKLNLLWNLLQKVQNVIHLEGPQYILEVFLQFSLTWLASTDEIDNEISILIFKLLLALFKKDFEDLVGCDKKMFPPLQFDIFESKKVFHSFAEKFLNLFLYWRKLKNKSTILKIWKCFLEHCEDSCDSMAIPIWHKIFKIMSQICSERNESIKDRLLFLHRCATTLKSVLCSSKFIDYGNLLTTPCEALLKKLMELCTIESEEIQDPELFFLSQEITQVLSEESVTIGEYDLCTFVLDLLEEFSIKSLFWGVWCGLVYCFKMRLSGIERSKLNKMEMKFFRKLRSVAVNFDLDRNYLDKNCSIEVERHIQVLNISCFCKYIQNSEKRNYFNEFSPERMKVDNENDILENAVGVFPKLFQGAFSTICLYSKSTIPKAFEVAKLNLDLVKNFLKTVKFVSPSPLLEGLFEFQYISFQGVKNFKGELEVHILNNDKKISLISNEYKQIPAIEYSTPPRSKKNDSRLRKNVEENEEEIVTTPKTRSKRRAEEEDSKREMNELQKKKKRKSFEVLIQEIVRKNKIRKTEKNSNKKSLPSCKRQKRKVTEEKVEEEKENEETNQRQLRNLSKGKNRIEKKNDKTKRTGRNSVDSKLENYFKVLTKKSGGEKKEVITETLKKRKYSQKEAGSYVEKNDFEKKETGFKQTSLKALMSSSGLKTENTKEEKEKLNRSSKSEKLIAKDFIRDPSELLKLSPFKEVFHDHDYTKIEPPSPEVLERMLLGCQTKKLIIERKDMCKSDKMIDKKDIEIKEEPQKSKELLKNEIKSEINVKNEKMQLRNQVFSKKENMKKEGEFQNEEENLNVKPENKLKKENILDVISEVNSQRVLRKRKDKTEEPKKTKNEIKTTEKLTKSRVTRKSVIEKENQKKNVNNNENVLINEKKENSAKFKKGRKSLKKVEVEGLSESINEKESISIADEAGKKIPKDEEMLTKFEDPSEDSKKVIENGLQDKVETKKPELCTNLLDVSHSLEKNPPKEEKILILKTTSLMNEQKVDSGLSTGMNEFLIQEKSESENKDLTDNEVLIEEKENVAKISMEEKPKTEKSKELDSPEDYGGIKSENKRLWLTDNFKPNKRIKLDIEGVIEPLLKVMEKENLETEPEKKECEKEEKLVPVVKVKSDTSSKTVNGNVSSRALRMIALVPESTRAEQMHRESVSKLEVLKSKKAPNVDKNSRASKMLALLSGNVVKDMEHFEEPEEMKLQEDVFEKKLTCTPNMKSHVSTLKSPNSIKKRRSIRFDDAKNETVLFEIDTPPSQILEEKEKYRRIKLQDINPPFL